MYPATNQYSQESRSLEQTAINHHEKQIEALKLTNVLRTPELFAEIGEFMNLTAIINLASTCKEMHQIYQVAQPNLYSLLAKQIGLQFNPKQSFQSQYTDYCQDLHRHIIVANSVFADPFGITKIFADPKSLSTKTILQVEYLWNLLKIFNAWTVGTDVHGEMGKCLKFPQPRKLETLADCATMKTEMNDWYTRHLEVLKSVDRLATSYHFIRHLPIEITLLENLKYLDLYECKLKELPIGFEKLNKLENLNLQENELTSFPTAICSLYNLKTLNFRSNLLESLPTEIGELSSLQRLFLASNKLRTIPTEICNLNKLVMIELSDNDFRIEELPKEILTWTEGKMKQ